jgi:two-component system, LytTR family, response regulator
VLKDNLLQDNLKGYIMKPIRTLIVDDNEDSLDIIEIFMENNPDFEITGKCKNGEELIDQVIVQKPDLVITDINMPKKNGLQAIHECLSLMPRIKFLFITGYDEFALKAFDINAVDYIVKPVEKARFYQALKKAKTAVEFDRYETGKIMKDEMGIKNLSFKTAHSVVYIPLTDIYFIEKSGKKSLIYTKDKVFEISDSMGKLAEKLDDTFFAGHRSYLINLTKISHITPHNETFIAYFYGLNQQASISKLKINEIRERISNLIES